MKTILVSKDNACKLLSGGTILRETKGGIPFQVSVGKDGFSLSQKERRLQLGMKELNKLLETQNGDGFLSFLKEKVVKYGSKVVNVIKKHVAPNFTTSYQLLANAYRATLKGSRPLDKGELHPLGYNYLGPNTNIEKYHATKPIDALDALARAHDLAYLNAKPLSGWEKTDAVHNADKFFLDELKLHPEKYNSSPMFKYAQAIIQGKFNVEQLIKLLGSNKTLFSG
jgi:hypothetical protein